MAISPREALDDIPNRIWPHLHRSDGDGYDVDAYDSFGDAPEYSLSSAKQAGPVGAVKYLGRLLQHNYTHQTAIRKIC